MNRWLKRIHIVGTLWFLLCAATLLVISLRQAGLSWWVVFSLSGYGAVLFIFLAVIYAFAIYRGVVRAQCAVEHPLSTTPMYLFFYDVAPFLGTIAGLFGCVGVTDISLVFRMAVEGSVGMTFFVWVVIDTTIGLTESFLPASRKARLERLAALRAEKHRRQLENAQLLEQIVQRQKELQHHWFVQFEQPTKQLAGLLASGHFSAQAKSLAIQIGANAWQAGKIPCMRYVLDLLAKQLATLPADASLLLWTAIWWDGIGQWRTSEIKIPTV